MATAAGGWSLWAAPAGASATFSPELRQVEKSSAMAAESASAPYTLRKATSKRATKIVKPKPATRSMQMTGSTSSSGSGSSLSKARALLAAQIAKHPILKGTTVSFGDARGYQAIAYYGSGRIVISPNHTASLERIIAHEVWHVIDWRDNGKIDWGENVPR